MKHLILFTLFPARNTIKALFIISIAIIASLNILAQGYRNPVLPGFHADPSVCTNGKECAC